MTKICWECRHINYFVFAILLHWIGHPFSLMLLLDHNNRQSVVWPVEREWVALPPSPLVIINKTIFRYFKDDVACAGNSRNAAGNPLPVQIRDSWSSFFTDFPIDSAGERAGQILPRFQIIFGGLFTVIVMIDYIWIVLCCRLSLSKPVPFFFLYEGSYVYILPFF